MSPETAPAPFALTARSQSAVRLAHLNASARRAGLYPGQAATEARALFPQLALAEYDPFADERDMARLLTALLRYSPLVGRAGPAGAFLDIAGATHLFGGEADLLADLAARLAHFGLAARAAIADTAGAAYALAAASRPYTAFSSFIAPPGDHVQAIAPLPVAALRIDPKTAALLSSLGLETIGAVLACPRKPLAQRCGRDLLRRIDEATGAARESLSPIEPPTDYSVAAVVAEPLVTLDAALEVARRLALDLAQRLERAGKGARGFTLHLIRLDGSGVRTVVRLARPTRAPAAILRLLRLRLERGEAPVEPGFGFESFRLSAHDLGDLAPQQQAAFAAQGVDQNGRENGRESEDIIPLTDSLATHLGAGAVFRLEPVDAHLPERAERRRLAEGAPAPDTAAVNADAALPRPLFMLPSPEPLGAIALAPDGPPARIVWRRVAYRIVRAAGPERLLGNWREGEDIARDYYRLEDEVGRRYWVFREGLAAGGRWFLHGLFA